LNHRGIGLVLLCWWIILLLAATYRVDWWVADGAALWL